MADKPLPPLASKKFYICDPNKNVKCAGRFQPHCGKQCFCTTNIEYSKDPKPLTHAEYYIQEGMRIRLSGKDK